MPMLVSLNVEASGPEVLMTVEDMKVNINYKYDAREQPVFQTEHMDFDTEEYREFI